LADGKVSRVEHAHLDQNGEKLYFEITTYPSKNEKGEVHRIIHLSRNITEQKRAEEEIRRQGENIKLFAYAITHDLRNPAIGVRRLAERLSITYGDLLDERENSTVP